MAAETSTQQHAVHLTLSGDDVSGTLTCNAPEGAPCRLGCPEGTCEFWSQTKGCQHGHIVDSGKCLAAEWAAATGILIQHGGTEPAEIRSGPVEIWWEDPDVGWLWSYPEAKPANAYSATGYDETDEIAGAS